MIAEVLRTEALDPQLAEFIIQQSGGNPYYSEELVRYLIEQGFLEGCQTEKGTLYGLSTGVQSKRVPPSLNGLLGARIERLDPGAREVVSAASVMGRTFWAGLLEEMLSRTVERELELLTGQEIALPRAVTDVPHELEYIFKHVLLRDAAYDRIAKSQRKELHRLVADWIAKRGEQWGKGKLFILEALHRERAGEATRALVAWRTAAEKAEYTSALEAETALTGALELLDRIEGGEKDSPPFVKGGQGGISEPLVEGEKIPPGPPLEKGGDAGGTERLPADQVAPSREQLYLELLEKRAETRVTLGKLTQAEEDLQRYLALAKEPKDRARGLCKLGDMDFRRRRDALASARYREARDVAAQGAPLEKARALRSLARLVGHRQGKLGEAEMLINEAIAIAQRAAGAVSDASTAANLAQPAGIKDTDLHDLVADCKTTLGEFAGQRGNAQENERLWAEVVRYYEKKGTSHKLADALGNLGMCHTMQGEIEKAFEMHQKALSISEEIGYRRGVGHAFTCLASYFYHGGNLQKALEMTRKALAIHEETGDKEFIGWTLSFLGMLLDTIGDLEAALEMHRKHLAICEEAGDMAIMPYAMNYIGSMHRHKGDLDAALETYQKCLTMAEQMNSRYWMAQGMAGLGDVYCDQGDYEKALEMHQKSLAIYQDVGDKDGLRSGYASMGRLFKEKGDLDRAKEFHERYLALSEEVGWGEGKGWGRLALADIACARGELDEAERLDSEALALACKMGVKELEASCHLSLAETCAEKILERQSRSFDLVSGRNRASSLKGQSCGFDTPNLLRKARSSLEAAERIFDVFKGVEERERIPFVRVKVLIAEGDTTGALAEAERVFPALSTSPRARLRKEAAEVLELARKAAAENSKR